MLQTRVSQNRRDCGVAGTIRVAEAERLPRLRIVPALALGETLHVFRKEAIRRVVARELADAGGVGMTGNLAVGDPHRDPDRPLAPGAGSHHLQDPCLLRVGDGERFAFVAVAMLGHQAGHHLDGLAGGACPLQVPRSSAASNRPVPVDYRSSFRPPKVVSLMASWCSLIRPNTLYV